MYNLLVSSQFDGRREGTFEFSRSRFLEYSASSISAQLASLSAEAIECIKSWPCILLQEGRGQELAFLGHITALAVTTDDLTLTIQNVPSATQLINDDVWRMRAALDIEQFEFSRYHWSLKDRDLFNILAANGVHVDSLGVTRFSNRSLPAPARPQLVNAGRTIGEWGHTQIDDLLLEAGVDGLSAARTIGSRRDRANAILAFALAHPEATTAENALFSAFMVRKANLTTGSSVPPDTSGTHSAGAVATVPEAAEPTLSDRSPNRVFIVHGKNDSAKLALVSFLSDVGLEGIVLHEQPSMGRHLLTKFMDEAELVTFAIVLMTDDDVGAAKGTELAPRARQNAILELGYFLSHLGQERVCALITPGLETPSDFDGIVYIRMDDVGEWKKELHRELRAAGMPLAK